MRKPLAEDLWCNLRLKFISDCIYGELHDRPEILCVPRESNDGLRACEFVFINSATSDFLLWTLQII